MHEDQWEAHNGVGPAEGKGETRYPACVPWQWGSDHIEQPVGWTGCLELHKNFLSQEGGWPLFCLPFSAWLWWKLKPSEVQQRRDAITQEGQAPFEPLIFKSENLENPATSTPPPQPPGHHSLQRKASCLHTDTEGPVSVTYPLGSGPPLCQLPSLSGKQRGRKKNLQVSAACHIHLHNWINKLHFGNYLNMCLYETFSEISIRINLLFHRATWNLH